MGFHGNRKGAWVGHRNMGVIRAKVWFDVRL